MKVHNKLIEIQKISRYSKYLDKKLIPEINKLLNLDLKPSLNGSIYDTSYSSMTDESGEVMDMRLKFTTNDKRNEGLCWVTFVIAGRTVEVGSITGDLKYDSDIIEDSYYYFFEEVEASGKKLTGV